jgi:predicted Zn-dependent protease
MMGLNAKPQMVPRVHALIGKAYAETGRTQEAIEQLKMGASSDVSGSLHYQLARLYRKMGDSKNASAALEEMKTIKQRRRKEMLSLMRRSFQYIWTMSLGVSLSLSRMTAKERKSR